MSDKDSEHKRPNECLAMISAACAGSIVTAMLAVLGGKVEVNLPKKQEGRTAYFLSTIPRGYLLSRKPALTWKYIFAGCSARLHHLAFARRGMILKA